MGKGNGLANCEIYSIWLKFPALDRPFLEIHQHKVMHDRGEPRVNEPGFGHLSFHMDDIRVLSEIIHAGGSQIGDITYFGTQDQPYLIAYARNPEGNILELEQAGDGLRSWLSQKEAAMPSQVSAAHARPPPTPHFAKRSRRSYPCHPFMKAFFLPIGSGRRMW
ncbi:hypothetical protein [Ensifer sp. LBL]|uniref:hypothetical protein n=1 Tax=Ensifer sp. LBL TaxID=2991056 RepID=UPI003D19DCA3